MEVVKVGERRIAFAASINGFTCGKLLSPYGTTGNSLLLASLGEGIERSPQSNGNMLKRLTSFCGEYS